MPSAFRLGLGHVALDFVATVGDRRGKRIERLDDPEALSAWLVEAEVVDTPQATRAQLDQARALREAIYRVIDRALVGGRLPSREVALVNEWARKPIAAPQIGRAFKREAIGPDGVTAALAQIARESVELVTGSDLTRVRTCAGCSLLFVDRSRPGQRRWCSMERCGNRDKTARYRQKARH